MRLIDADDLKQAVYDSFAPYQCEWATIIRQVSKVIDCAPTIEATPVVHGKWIWADDGYCRCSECKQKAPVIRQYQDEPITTMTSYCHYCGAKMDMRGNQDE